MNASSHERHTSSGCSGCLAKEAFCFPTQTSADMWHPLAGTWKNSRDLQGTSQRLSWSIFFTNRSDRHCYMQRRVKNSKEAGMHGTASLTQCSAHCCFRCLVLDGFTFIFSICDFVFSCQTAKYFRYEFISQISPCYFVKPD